MQDNLVEVDVDGERRWHLAAHTEALVATRPDPTVVLLPGKDAWVMGPGTEDVWVVPSSQRATMTRGANPVVVDGSVAGTWRVDGDVLAVTSPPADGLAAEAARLGTLLGLDLVLRTP